MTRRQHTNVRFREKLVDDSHPCLVRCQPTGMRQFEQAHIFLVAGTAKQSFQYRSRWSVRRFMVITQHLLAVDGAQIRYQ